MLSRALTIILLTVVLQASGTEAIYRRKGCAFSVVHSNYVKERLIPSLAMIQQQAVTIPLQVESVQYLVERVLTNFLQENEFHDLNFSDVERELRKAELPFYLFAVPRASFPLQYRIEYPTPSGKAMGQPLPFGALLVVGSVDLNATLKNLGITTSENLERLAGAGWPVPPPKDNL